MTRLILIMLVAAVVTGGCANYPDPRQQRMDAMTQHYAQFDVVMAWDTKVAGGKTVIDGVVKNVRYAYMYDLEIWVAVLDEAGKVKARSVSYIIPRRLDMDEAADFSLKLPMAAAPGTRLRFTYRYRGSEGGEGSEGGVERGPNWMQSFETRVPAQ